jgi:hypothetical protein
MSNTTALDPTAVVIEIDDTVDVVPVPEHLATRAAELVGADALPGVLQLIALLIARLGDHAEPAIRAWMEYTPSVLTNFPAPLLDELVTGRIGPLKGPPPPVFPAAGVTFPGPGATRAGQQ